MRKKSPNSRRKVERSKKSNESIKQSAFLILHFTVVKKFKCHGKAKNTNKTCSNIREVLQTILKGWLFFRENYRLGESDTFMFCISYLLTMQNFLFLQALVSKFDGRLLVEPFWLKKCHPFFLFKIRSLVRKLSLECNNFDKKFWTSFFDQVDIFHLRIVAIFYEINLCLHRFVHFYLLFALIRKV